MQMRTSLAQPTVPFELLPWPPARVGNVALSGDSDTVRQLPSSRRFWVSEACDDPTCSIQRALAQTGEAPKSVADGRDGACIARPAALWSRGLPWPHEGAGARSEKCKSAHSAQPPGQHYVAH